MPEERKWQEWLERLHNLRRDKRGSHERPHKPVLLPSLLDLLDRGQVKNNWMSFGSGSLPSTWKSAILRALSVRKPYDFLNVTLTLLFRPSMTPPEIAFFARK